MFGEIINQNLQLDGWMTKGISTCIQLCKSVYNFRSTKSLDLPVFQKKKKKKIQKKDVMICSPPRTERIKLLTDGMIS